MVILDKLSSHKSTYGAAPALGDDRKCGMSYVVEYITKGTDTITMNFRMIDYNRIQIIDIEAGRKTGSAATLKKLATALHVDMDDLFDAQDQ